MFYLITHSRHVGNHSPNPNLTLKFKTGRVQVDIFPILSNLFIMPTIGIKMRFDHISVNENVALNM